MNQFKCITSICVWVKNMCTFTKCKYNRYIFVVKTGNKDFYVLFCESSMKYALNMTEVLTRVFKSPKLNCKIFKLWDFNAAYPSTWEALWTCTHLGIPRLSSLLIIYSARMRPAFVTVTVYHSILAKIVWYSFGVKTVCYCFTPLPVIMFFLSLKGALGF